MIKFEQIAKANENIKTTDIKGKEYAEVNQRIKAFRMVYPNGAIITDILNLENGTVVIKATVYDEDQKIIGTGIAYEKENSTFINKTSYIENCETSAVGRALGMCGFGIDTSVCSAEELSNALLNQNQNKTNTYQNDIKPECTDCGKEISVKAHDWTVKHYGHPYCEECYKNHEKIR